MQSKIITVTSIIERRYIVFSNDPGVQWVISVEYALMDFFSANYFDLFHWVFWFFFFSINHVSANVIQIYKWLLLNTCFVHSKGLKPVNWALIYVPFPCEWFRKWALIIVIVSNFLSLSLFRSLILSNYEISFDSIVLIAAECSKIFQNWIVNLSKYNISTEYIDSNKCTLHVPAN